MRLVPARGATRAIGVAAVSKIAAIAAVPKAAAIAAVPCVAAAVLCVPTAAAAPAPAVQSIGLTYSGFSCPLNPTLAKSGADTTLIITTATNFTMQTVFEVPSRNIRTPLPLAFSAINTHVHLGMLEPGSIAYRIVAPPMTGSYGWSCQGEFRVTS